MKLISSWTLLSSGKNELFSQRWGHTANLIGNSVYVYGGFANKYLKSMYIIDLSSFPPCQEKIEPKTLPPKLQLTRSSFINFLWSKNNLLWRNERLSPISNRDK